MSLTGDKVSSPIEKACDKSINDFDSSLILENIDLSAKNKAVKINLKIIALEKELAKITEQVELMCLLNLDKDKQKKEKFMQRKARIEKQLSELKTERKNYGAFYTIADFAQEKIKFNKFKNSFDNYLPLIKKYYALILNSLKSLKNYNSIFRW